MNKFIVTYKDGTNFQGDPLKSEWKLIDYTKKITKLEYFLDKICICMEGYAEYAHFKECLGLGQKGINRILLMGRTNEETEIVVIDLKQNKIYKDFKPKYREYGDQVLAYWQQGVLTTPKITIKKNGRE